MGRRMGDRGGDSFHIKKCLMFIWTLLSLKIESLDFKKLKIIQIEISKKINLLKLILKL